jgi:hypothetical protein
MGRPSADELEHLVALRRLEHRRCDRRADGRFGRRADSAGGLIWKLREITSKHGILLIFDK